MSKAPISVCMICKNEEIQLENCLKSFRDYVEEIIVVDTGSTDRSPEIAKKYADKFEVYTACNDEVGRIEDFSRARQRSLDLATKKWALWIDSDDQLQGAEHLAAMVKKHDHVQHDMLIMFPYEYAHDASGNATCVHYRERLINNKNNFHWVGEVHEVLMPKNPTQFGTDRSDDIRFIHRRSSNKPMESGRNLRILKKVYEKNGDSDPRQLYYLGLEYANNNDLENSNKFLHKYVAMSGWDDEKCLAYMKIAENYLRQNNIIDAIKAGLLASSVQEKWGEPLFLLAKCYYYLGILGGPDAFRNWQKCAHYAKLGLSYPPTETVLFLNPLDRKIDIHRYANVAMSNIGDVEGALESVNQALLFDPNDSQLNYNKFFYKKHLIRSIINTSMNEMLNNNAIDKSSYDSIMVLLDKPMGPEPIQINNIVQEKIKELKINNKNIINCFLDDAKNLVVKESEFKEKKLDVVFFVGDGLETWTPETVKKSGIGGSELMAIQMSKELAALGHTVRLFSGCGSDGEGIFDGVEYVQTAKFKDLECDILVVSRNAQFLDETFNIKSKLKLLWVHDMVIVNYKHALGLKADKILALSQWHKENLMREHNLRSDHIVVTRNGVYPERFKNKNIKRDKFKCINSSSPDRSLPVLLEVWPEIKKRVPLATLSLCYGFDNWKKIAPHRGSGEVETIARLEKQIEELKPLGVTYKGRISQEELSNEMLSAGVWAFPTHFSETSCVGAMESQISSLRIVSSAKAALNETVFAGTLIEGEWTSPEYKAKFVDAVVASMLKDDESDREAIAKEAEKRFDMYKLAQEWDQMFYNLIEDLKQNPIIKYNSTAGF